MITDFPDMNTPHPEADQRFEFWLNNKIQRKFHNHNKTSEAISSPHPTP